MDKKKIILDCDPGMDDSMAIVMACKSEALDVLAVTTVNGNYPAEVTCVNALKVLEMIGRTDVPVGKGMVAPMVRATPKDPFSHGADGQAENFLPEPTTPRSPKHAIDLIIDLHRPHEQYCNGHAQRAGDYPDDQRNHRYFGYVRPEQVCFRQLYR